MLDVAVSRRCFCACFLVNLWRRILFSGGVPGFLKARHPTGSHFRNPSAAGRRMGASQTRLVGQECLVGSSGFQGSPESKGRPTMNEDK